MPVLRTYYISRSTNSKPRLGTTQLGWPGQSLHCMQRKPLTSLHACEFPLETHRWVCESERAQSAARSPHHHKTSSPSLSARPNRRALHARTLSRRRIRIARCSSLPSLLPPSSPMLPSPSAGVPATTSAHTRAAHRVPAPRLRMHCYGSPARPESCSESE